MPLSYPIGVTVPLGAGFNGTGQGANVEVVLGDVGVIPANFLDVATILQFEIGLRVSLVSSSTARTLRFGLRMGGLTGVILLNTGALAVPVSTTLTSSPAILRGHLTQRTIGVSGNATCAATMPNRFFATVQDNAHPFSVPWTLSTYDTTAQQTITFTVGESVNTVADTVQMESAVMWAVTPH